MLPQTAHKGLTNGRIIPPVLAENLSNEIFEDGGEANKIIIQKLNTLIIGGKHSTCSTPLLSQQWDLHLSRMPKKILHLQQYGKGHGRHLYNFDTELQTELYQSAYG